MELKKFTHEDLSSYLESYYQSYAEASDKDKTADEKLKTQDVKTGDVDGAEGDMSAPLIYSHIVKALHKNDISEKKIIHIIQDIAEANGDDMTEELATKIAKES